MADALDPAALREVVQSWFDEYNGTDPGVGGWYALEVNLAARQPAPTDAETTTEWGVRVGSGPVRPMRDEAHTTREAETLNALFETPREWAVVSRKVSPWKEVRHDG